MAKTITIRVGDKDPDIKGMLLDLRVSKHKGNPYIGRSESVLAKMLLLKEASREHKRFCAQKKSRRSKEADKG